MPALREVIAQFTVRVDNKPLTELDARIEATKAKIDKLSNAAVVSFGAAAFGIYKMIQAASDAREQLNVLNQTFGKDGTQNILQWSEAVGSAMGRSKFEIQKAVGQFGAFLQPTFRETGEDFQKMSKSLSALAIDLASFYNTSDQEAQMRLFSGISGETEAVRRLGIDLSDAALDAFNKTGGAVEQFGDRGLKMSKKLYARLSLPEKTLLRYGKILKDTREKQGDAERTAGEWEGSLKRVKAKLSDMVTTMGEDLIPRALEWLKVAETWIDLAEKLLKGTDLLTNAMIGLAASFIALKFHALVLLPYLAGGLAAVGASLWAVAFPAVALIGSFLILDEIITFFRGGQTVFGTMIQELTGVQDPLKFVNDLISETIDNIGRLIKAFGYLFEQTPIMKLWNLSGRVIDRVQQGFTGSDLSEDTKQADKEGALFYRLPSAEGFTSAIGPSPGSVRIQKEFEARQRASETGDLQSAIDNTGPFMSRQQSAADFFRDRPAELLKNPGSLTDLDKDLGFSTMTPKEVELAVKIYNEPLPGPYGSGFVQHFHFGNQPTTNADEVSRAAAKGAQAVLAENKKAQANQKAVINVLGVRQTNRNVE